MYEVSVRLKANQSGYSAELAFVDSSGQQHERQLQAERKASQNSNYLQALIDALCVLQNPCMLSIYSACDHLTEAVRQGWLNSWAQNEWKNCRAMAAGQKAACQPLSAIYKRGEEKCLTNLENLTVRKN